MKYTLPQHPVFRPSTVDRDVWAEAVELNTYKLPDFFAPGENVLNVGAHTGSVAWRCAMSGARVLAVEPSAENYKLLLHNLIPVADRVLTVHAAVWRSDAGPATLRFEPNWTPANTGGGGVMGDAGGAGHDVLALPLDDLLRLRESWRLIVIDCEGAEFNVLGTSRELARVHEIAGEFHERAAVKPFADCGMPHTVHALREFLASQGFAVEAEPKGPGMGLFFARRP